jgi:PAS domain S-box-containing protein
VNEDVTPLDHAQLLEALGVAVRTLDFLGRSSGPVVVVGGAGTLLYANPAASSLLGWQWSDLAQRAIVDAPEARAAASLDQALAAASASPQASGSVELHVVRPDGSDVWVEADLTDSFDGGDAGGVMWWLRDVTTRRRADERVRARLEQLESALTSRVVIEQAKGFLAATNGGSPDDGFALLRAYARDNNVELREAARRALAREITLP